MWVGYFNDSITDDGETRIIPYYVIIRHRRTLPDMDTPPHPPRGSGRGPQTGYGKNQDSRALLSLARAKIPPPESCLSLVYRGFLGGF